MPSISDKTERHVVIDQRDDEYICFPDVLRADDGRLIVVYNESDQHVGPSRRVLLLKQSHDNGKTWEDYVRMPVNSSHCPRLSKLEDGEILIADTSGTIFHSTDSGDTWQPEAAHGMYHDIFDKIIDLGEDTFITAGHVHRGSVPQPAIRQAPSEQMLYRSFDRGENWKELTVINRERNLVLCEASMILLPDERLICLMRENSFVYEPMYLCISEDKGETWGEPISTPLIGHRPTMGQLKDGRLLITYRNVAPDGGTVAWLGTLDELMGDYQVHGRHGNPANPVMTDEGMQIKNDEGVDSMVRYALRPMTDPRKARAVLEAEVRVDEADENGCGLRLGTWWKITPDSITPDLGEETETTSTPLEPGQFNTIRLEFHDEHVTLAVNGEHKTSIKINEDEAMTRPVMFGQPWPFEDNSVNCTWKWVRQTMNEPHMLREYSWGWKAEDGFPDQWAQDNILELRNARYAQAPDYGYSGWTELEDGSFFCTYHHADGTDEDYDPLFTSHICGTWFTFEDFKK